MSSADNIMCGIRKKCSRGRRDRKHGAETLEEEENPLPLLTELPSVPGALGLLTILSSKLLLHGSGFTNPGTARVTWCQ